MELINRARWTCQCNKGSLTFHENAAHDKNTKIAVFVDLDNKLAKRFGITLHPNPFVVGVDLTYEDPAVRHQIRKWLRKAYKSYYLDPCINGNAKVCLQPNSDHPYDIVFLPRSPCPEHSDDDAVRRKIDKKLNGVIETGRSQ